MSGGACLNQLRERPVNVDLIRTVAIIGVLLLHAAGSWTTTPQEMSQLNTLGLFRFGFVDIYQTLARIGVPLFVMLTGALLLEPSKNEESLRVFFKKRWVRIGLPFLFWGVIYFAWDFLVIKIPFTTTAVLQGILNGPYTQFWYLYVLAGLYLLTPILRIFMAHANEQLVKYFVIVWVVGVSLVPVFLTFTSFTLNNDLFTLTGFVGYFILGALLMNVKIRRSSLYLFTLLGIALTALATYLLAVAVGGAQMYFFQGYFSPTIVLASVMVFMLLLTVTPPTVQEESKVKPSKINRLLKLISENTLAIFLFHVIVMETLEFGYLGFALNRDLLNPIIEVPLITVITLFVCLAIIVPLKKIPYLKRLIG
jgi:surface polysaccharide O-acyltransferase-like enzyme